MGPLLFSDISAILYLISTQQKDNMKPSIVVNTVINIAAVITILFAIPIVMPVSAAIGTLLIIFSALFSLGIVAQIYMAYQ